MPASPSNSSAHRFGSYEFEPRAGELRKQGIRIRLEGQPLAILTMLLDRPGELITREELQKRLWPADTFVDFEHSLNAAIKRLRAALNEAPRAISKHCRAEDIVSGPRSTALPLQRPLPLSARLKVTPLPKCLPGCASGRGGLQSPAP